MPKMDQWDFPEISSANYDAVGSNLSSVFLVNHLLINVRYMLRLNATV